MNPKIKSIIENFDFEKVHKVMKALNWGWYSKDEDELIIPSISQMIMFAQDMLYRALEEKQSFSSGGFWARYIEYKPEEIKEGEDSFDLQLLFVVEE